MAKSQNKIDTAAKKRVADRSENSVDMFAVEKAVGADAAPVKADAVAKAVAENPMEPAAKKRAEGTNKNSSKAKTTEGREKARPGKVSAKTARTSKPSSTTRKNAADKTNSAPNLKDTIMATAQNTTNTVESDNIASDMQARAKAAYEKGTEMTQEAVEFQKGNFEAIVESSKIFATGMQDMGRTYVEEAKIAADTVQDDVKKFAAVKSPTELFQLQGEIARRNFDAMVSTASKNTEAMMKLANEAFAPVSNRMSLAAEKVRTAA